MVAEFSPHGCQWVAVAGVGLASHDRCQLALENLRTMASLARPEGKLRSLLHIEMEGEPVICASLPICTPWNQLSDEAEILGPEGFYDPNGVAATFAAGRNTVVTTDNLIHVSRAESTLE